MRWLIPLFVLVTLTVLSQVGGIAFLVAQFFRRKLVVFVVMYGAIWGGVQVVAPEMGREALPCFGSPLRMQSPLYCGLMRNFVTPEMAQVARDAADEMAVQFPGTVTLALDGNLPFLDGFPLIPHLSHDDGEKLDIAFYYQTDGHYRAGHTRSPVGYFAFEGLRGGAWDATCPPVRATLRWDLRGLQSLWSDAKLDRARTAALLGLLAGDGRVSKIFVEPVLQRDLGLTDEKIRFQGCRAARHDDHIHIQL